MTTHHNNIVAVKQSASYKLKIFAGTSNRELAKEICTALGEDLSLIEIKRFADKEIGVQIGENVRGCDVFVVQSSCTPVNDNLMELFLIVDALRRASASRVTAVIPYYGYARQDRKTRPRVPISAALVAHLLETSGVDRVLSVDLHCGQIQGFFKAPVDNLYAYPILCAESAKLIAEYGDNITIVSPDAGGVERADLFRKAVKSQYNVECGMAVMNKSRVEANKIAKMELVGSVKDTNCVIVDDMIDTAGTLCTAAQVLKDNGAKRVFACATHALLNTPAVENIKNSCLDKVFVGNTVPIPEEKRDPKISIVSVGKLIAEAVRRVHAEESVSVMF